MTDAAGGAAQVAVAEPARAETRWLRSARVRALIAGGIIILALFFLFGGDGWLTVLDYTMIAAIATLGLNVLSGYAGQVSLGISFFMAVGAYTAAWLGGDPPTGPLDPAGHGLSWLIWLPAAGIVAALVGALVGPTALRLKGFYLGIVTLALVFIGQHIFNNAKSLSGGPAGRNFPAPGFGDFSFADPTPIFGVSLSTNQLYFLLILLVLIVCALFVANAMRTRSGRAFQAVRDHEVGAAILGVNLFRTKMEAFILSSFLAGIAGALYASYARYTIPNYWDLVLSIQFVAAIIVGGVASVWGSILGAAFVFALPEVIDQFSLLPQSASSTGISSGDLNAVIYGLLIVAFLLFEPAGVMGLIRRVQSLTRRYDTRRKGGEPARGGLMSVAESQFDTESAPLSESADVSPSAE